MLLLFETPAGYSLFQISDSSKLESVEDISKIFEDEKSTKKYVELINFKKFKDTNQAVKSLTELNDGKLPSDLKKFLKKNIINEGINDTLLCKIFYLIFIGYRSSIANCIKNELDIKTKFKSKYLDVFRGIREQLTNLISGLSEKDFKNGSVGLAHNFYRHKLKFSVDKVDIMVIQAVGLLDDLDKELNNYAMRLREWYGWHFPEAGKIIQDNLTFAKLVQAVGMRTNARNLDLSEIVSPEDEAQIKEAAEISMGSEISLEDEKNIKELCDQVVYLSEYRAALSEYLKSRMMAIAPNLTIMVGELVAARLISHAGSLISLAKMPASTIQIFGAEKALFRALKTKHETPKYGLIYHASLVGQTNPKIKGKISRSLASKCALCVRVDALGENTEGELGKKSKKVIEARISALESGNSGVNLKKGKKIEKYNPDENKKKGMMNEEDEAVLIGKKTKRDEGEKKKKKEESSDEEDEIPMKKSNKKPKKEESSDEEDDIPMKKSNKKPKKEESDSD